MVKTVSSFANVGELDSVEFLYAKRQGLGQTIGEVVVCGSGKVMLDNQSFTAPDVSLHPFSLSTEDYIAQDLTEMVKADQGIVVCGKGYYRKRVGITETLRIHLIDIYEQK